jgi:adenylate cyclase
MQYARTLPTIRLRRDYFLVMFDLARRMPVHRVGQPVMPIPRRERQVEMTSIASLLRRAEVKAERISALARLGMFLFLALAIFSAAPAGQLGDSAKTVAALYGLGTAVGLLLAWRPLFHPTIPYLFVTFDVVLVAVQVLTLARLMGMPSDATFALPAGALIFVIMIHASMRYRPWLVVYGAALFIISIEVGRSALAGDPARSTMMGAMSSMPRGGMAEMLNYQFVPLGLVALAALLLFIIGVRTRVLLVRSIEQTRRASRLSRYFSPNLAARLAEGDDAQLLAGRRQPAAVLFVDIRGFTALGENMAPDELSTFLTEYRNRLAQPVFSHGGTVDKFIGDAIMAVFGSPFQREDDAARAVHCALDMLDAATRWSSERQQAGRSPVAIGIGAHYGEVFAGALGNEQLLEYTVIGDTVNVAERLERLSREVHSPVVVSATLLQAAGHVASNAKWRHLPPQELKGHRKPIDAFCLL